MFLIHLFLPLFGVYKMKKDLRDIITHYKSDSKQLIEARELIDGFIKDNEKMLKKQLREEFRAKAKALDLDLYEIVGSPRGRKAGVATGEAKSKSEPTHRDPDNTDNTWAGRGRKPKWLEKALKAGKKVEDFEI